MAQQSGEEALAKILSELAEIRREQAESRRLFNLSVRSQASFVAAARQAEEAAQARHRLVLNAIGNLRPLILSEPSEAPPDRVVVTDRTGHRTGQMPVLPESKPKGEISGSFNVGGVQVQLDSSKEHFGELLSKSVRWILVVLGMALTGGIGWLVGFVKQIGEHHK